MKSMGGGMLRKFGVELVGDIPWGTHLCQFYQTKKDLVDIVVPYFAEGLRNNEFCMWVTSPPLKSEEARKALKKAVPNLEEFIGKGQIKILSFEDWYLSDREFDADRVLQGWVDKEKDALKRGFEGLRLTGNTFWIERNNWKSFVDYEAMVNGVIGSHRMIALCTYSLKKCTGNDVVDVMRNHVGTLIRKGKTWNLVENVAERKRAEQALQESQRDLNHAQAVAKTGSWRLDVRHNELLWSDETYRMFGITKGTPMTYEAFLSTVHPDDREYVDKRWKAALSGEPYDIEHRIVVDGEVKWVRERAELEFNADRSLLGGFGTVQDITERKRIEDELRETSDYLDSLLNYANAPIIVWDPEFKITKFNHAFERLTGHKAEEVLSKNLSTLFPEQSREVSLTEIRHTLAGEYWEVVEIPILRKDGNVRTVLWNSANIYATDGKTLRATIAQGQDITERKQLEEKLIHSERKYRTLYETTVDGIVSFDMDGHIIECNDAYARMLGYSKDELKGMTYQQLTPEKWHKMEDNIIKEQIIKRGHSDLYEKEHIKRDGSIFPISIRVWLTRDEKWKPVAMWGIIRDITLTKHMQNELKRYAEHLESLVEERTEKLKDAERLATIGETAAMVGHDIRNPLQTIEGAIYLAKEETKSLPTRTQEIDNIEEMLNTIQEETEYVDKIVSDLQDYARPLTPELEETDVQKLINSVLTENPVPPNIGVSVTVEQDCCTVVVDPTMMKRILANLITNAVQAMPNGGKLTIQASKKEEQVSISVRDTGMGISRENKPKMFQPLFSTKAKGQGFGLAVVKRLVEAHNGTITFESEAGKGTTFTVAIPLAKEVT